MGMFDIITFENHFTCPDCAAIIDHTQTKEFDNVLNVISVSDYVLPPEETKIIVEDLYCYKCDKIIDKNIYLSIYKGILIGVFETINEAESALNNFNMDNLLMLYYKLFNEMESFKHRIHKYNSYIASLIDWYRSDEKKENIFFAINKKRFKDKSLYESLTEFHIDNLLKEYLYNLKDTNRFSIKIKLSNLNYISEYNWSVDSFIYFTDHQNLDSKKELYKAWRIQGDEYNNSSKDNFVIIKGMRFFEEREIIDLLSMWLKENQFSFVVEIENKEIFGSVK